jgi:hypothetical protein
MCIGRIFLLSKGFSCGMGFLKGDARFGFLRVFRLKNSTFAGNGQARFRQKLVIIGNIGFAKFEETARQKKLSR